MLFNKCLKFTWPLLPSLYCTAHFPTDKYNNFWVEEWLFAQNWYISVSENLKLTDFGWWTRNLHEILFACELFDIKFRVHFFFIHSFRTNIEPRSQVTAVNLNQCSCFACSKAYTFRNLYYSAGRNTNWLNSVRYDSWMKTENSERINR